MKEMFTTLSYDIIPKWMRYLQPDIIPIVAKNTTSGAYL